MTKQISDSEFAWCPADARPGEFYKLRVRDLSPTQFVTGKAEVKVRAARMAKKLKKDPHKLHDYLRVRPVPIVVRNERFYLIDHHHLVRALHDIGHKLHGKDLAVFVKVMGFQPSDHPRILSSHHQAVAKIGKGLVAVASSRDGKVIEAVEHKKYPNVLGVQFHPEHPLLFDAEPQHRQKPGDAPTSFRAILEGTPPSIEFNQKIWSWFAGKLVESHGK